ncbi:keratin-associated protein 5-2-like [Pituophis catenifer annectens]|uniref:keratin-associated protein 5-2-like n=1 Tax=Pituophis catenifer annectens TaxID=94852 RepID=UPI0039950390
MPEERIYSSGREAYFNLNSTWYDPAGSWLDTRRKPFRYVDNTACVTCCNPRSNVPRRGGHNYRCYCYRQSTCTPGGNPRVRCCVHNPSGGPRDYWGRPIGDACDGCTGGRYSHTGSDCGSCCGSGGGTVACAQPCATSGGVCAEPGCRPSGRGVCSEPCITSSGGCGSRRGVCAEPGCRPAGRGVCAEPCITSSGGCGTGVCAEPACLPSGYGRRRRGVCFEPCAGTSGGC